MPPQATDFLNLPLEIRYLVYNYYLSTICSDLHIREETFVYKTILKDSVRLNIPLLATSKQIYWEIKSSLGPISTLSVRLSWQDRCYDAWSSFLLQMKNNKQAYGYDGKPHLRILIYPPIDGRATDILHIWQRTKVLCHELRKLRRISSLTIDFRGGDRWENILASPRQTMWFLCCDDHLRNQDDLTLILDLFATLTNVKDARMLFPKCFSDHTQLLESRKCALDIMTGSQKPLQSLEDLVDDVGRRLAHHEDDIMARTGVWSMRRLAHDIKKRQKKYSWDELTAFMKTHPHLNYDYRFQNWRAEDLLVWPDWKQKEIWIRDARGGKYKQQETTTYDYWETEQKPDEGLPLSPYRGSRLEYKHW
ncbi:MAG: hypothetical protein Q9219_003012 [cf. Caloplaca sp. 3 TL-2023]